METWKNQIPFFAARRSNIRKKAKDFIFKCTTKFEIKKENNLHSLSNIGELPDLMQMQLTNLKAKL